MFVLDQPVDSFVLAEIAKDNNVIARPTNFRARAFNLLDEIYEEITSSNPCVGMHLIGNGLNTLRTSTPTALWRQFAEVDCLAHPLREIVHQDPFTRRSFEKPRGYAGDAHMIDYIYGNASLPEDTTDLGAAIYAYTRQTSAPRGVIARRDVLAATVDEVANVVSSPRILSIACGHLREAQQSQAVREGRIGEYIGLDQDAESVALVNREQAHHGVRAVVGSVRGILSGKVNFSGLDLVYAAGLYDYLNASTATRLTTLMFKMLNSGGRLLIPNFAPCLRDIGYMESFMRWDLIYRNEAEVAALALGIDAAEVESARTFWEPNGTIVFLEVTKR